MAEVPVELPPPTAEGTFAKTPLVQVLVYVLERGLTGTIEVVHPNGPWATLLVLEGYPSKGRTSEPVGYLGGVLRELGYIDDGVLNSSLASMAKERRLHGQILLGSGQITAAQLTDGLRAQLVKKIEHLFDWPPDTKFSYYDGFDALHTYGGDDDVHLDPLPLVWAAIRTQPPWEHVHAALTRLGTSVMRIAPGAQLERFELAKEERAAVDVLRAQPMRLHELAGTKLLGASTTQLLVYCMLITKQVELFNVAEQTPAVARRVARVQTTQVAQRAAVEEQAVRLDPRAVAIKSENYFEMLGVAREATPEQVQTAFFALAKVWHPDRVPKAIAEVRDACATVFAHMSEAQQTLSDPKRRANYMELLKDGGATPDEQAQVQAVLEAATNFQKAEFYLKKNDLKEAEAHCRKARETDPQAPEYLAMLAWLEALKLENQNPDATLARIKMLDQAIGQNSMLERAYFYRGLLYKRLGDMRNAVRDFKSSAELNPRNLDAVREVRLYEMRKSKGSLPPPPPADAPPSSRRPGSVRPPPPGSTSKNTPAKAENLGLFGKLFKK
jgi:curved DNA-binding protein CbpA